LPRPSQHPDVQRIGLFGGSFDPVHLGHLLVAQAAFEELELSRLLFIPAAQSPFKPGSQPAPASARLAMLRLALAGQPCYEIDTQELERGGLSYSIDTAKACQARFPGAELHWLIGADHAAKLPLWREADALAELLRFVVICRPGEPVELPPPPFRARLLRGFPLDLSSSQVRARLKAGRPIGHMVPRAVAEYLQNKRLYL